MNLLHHRRTAALTASAAVTAVLLAGCTGSSGGSTTPTTKNTGSSSATGGHVADVTISAAKGCPAAAPSYAAGAVTFNVQNADANGVSEIELLSGERIVGEKENLPPGFKGGFTVEIGAGTYTLYCPGGTPERSTITVTGKATQSANTPVTALLKQASAGYATYVNTQVATLVTQVVAFDKALHGSDLAAARSAYMKARPYYERIEPVAESFPALDAAIDVRIADTSFASWTGFHRIEYGLFKQNSLTGLGAYGDGLLANVRTLKKQTAGLTYRPTELANGASGLLDEVAASKISGEEEAYSLIDLLDFAGNDEGSEQAFAQLQPALMKIDPVLTNSISAEFTALDKLVESYRTTSNASGYVLYSALKPADKRQLSAAVAAVQAPLAKVGSKVANA